MNKTLDTNILKTTKVRIPKLGMGTWKLEGKKCSERVSDAIEMGYEAVDTAQAYGNEAEVGEGIVQSGIKREDLFLTSKIWREDLSEKNVIKSTEESLNKLQTNYLDLMLIHWPNPDYDLEETFEGLKKLHDSKKIKHFGVSNFPIGLLNECGNYSSDFVCNQVEYHPYIDQGKMLDWLREHNKFLIAYSPLARGQVFDDQKISKIAKKHNAGIAQVVLAWQLSKPGLVTIPKASSNEHLKSNLESLSITLDPEDITAMDTMTEKNKRIVDPDFAPNWDA
jgi:diketogulonate reductase-like aldo/keto reductase